MTEDRGQRVEDRGQGPRIGRNRAQSAPHGFTLIELLVAMAILLIIVMITAQLFQQARQVVDTGSRRAETNMKGRAVADFMAQELSMAVRSTNYPTFTAQGDKADFWMLGEATNDVRAAQQISYTFVGGIATNGIAMRNGVPLCDGLDSVEFREDGAPYGASELPAFVDVIVSISDGGTPPTLRKFESRAHMVHRKRYTMD